MAAPVSRVQPRAVLVRHEEVAEVQMKVGMIRPDVRQGLTENVRTGVGIQMGVGCHRERERAPGGACGMKTVFRTRDKIAGVGRSRNESVVVNWDFPFGFKFRVICGIDWGKRI